MVRERRVAVLYRAHHQGRCHECDEVATNAVLILVAELAFGALCAYALMRHVAPSWIARLRDHDVAHYAAWWTRTLLMLWLMAQTVVIFSRIEDVELPQPYSWVSRAMSFATLGPVSDMFFSPCAHWLDAYRLIVATTLAPFAGLAACLAACAVHCGVARRKFPALWGAVYGRGYLLGFLMFHTSLCVSTFEFFKCDGPYEISPGRKRSVLAYDYAVSCDTSMNPGWK